MVVVVWALFVVVTFFLDVVGEPQLIWYGFCG